MDGGASARSGTGEPIPEADVHPLDERMPGSFAIRKANSAAFALGDPTGAQEAMDAIAKIPERMPDNRRTTNDSGHESLPLRRTSHLISLPARPKRDAGPGGMPGEDLLRE